MPSYYVTNYPPPAGITNRDQVIAMQKQLGVKADGMWGPQTDAAYKSANGSAIPQSYKNYLSEFQSLLQAPTVSYSGPSQAEIEASLRPTYDLAIKGRQQQTATNKANLDADAAARGMGSSTWVTDVKNRQQNYEADDIAGLEASYARELQSVLQQERANKLAADQYNASSQAASLQAALGLAGDFYGQSLATAKRVGGGTSTTVDGMTGANALAAKLTNANKGNLSAAASALRSGSTATKGYSSADIAAAEALLRKQLGGQSGVIVTRK